MITITYQDSYQQERTLVYDDMNAFSRAFMGCITVPDYLPVQDVTINGQSIGYKGTIGDLYRDISAMDLKDYL
ncbi:DUF4649 family protein [Streptococcus ovuberis]|uniref:DUF4649 family protein n=1 Tax=Streptococcus ovuberis TaxID=1936207 RepID=A0A7X6MZV7_9STRE|nr:DUF4649 family protein [Streptococcus ovuberis]NKZ20916.1 DUF4649 family protein [Streptococcus ovuberis]